MKLTWFNSLSYVKMALVAGAIVIAAASLVISHLLIRDLEGEERRNMEVWAEAMRTLSTADEATDISLVLTVLNGNETIPVVVTDKDGNVIDSRNVREEDIAAIQAGGHVIDINIGSDDRRPEYIHVWYDESLMLRRLAQYPYVQLGVVFLFVVVAIFALLSSKRAEQNKVWVGLSRETAHQLGTPISSLMAWTEVLKESYPDDELLPEMETDVRRLQLIAERFSKIGSAPELKDADLYDIVDHVVQYIGRRTSDKVNLHATLPEEHPHLMVCAPLFEWVIENLCKNAVDAMHGEGEIHVTATTLPERVVILVSDTGKGIAKKNFKNVFRPGFTTKKRGWGLGLSLAKRIVEEYHHGRIYVKSSELGKGTTFAIEMPLFS